jgi:pimeloyl-ACP methyl ester carboxylesterase
MRWPISDPTLRNDLTASLRVCATATTKLRRLRRLPRWRPGRGGARQDVQLTQRPVAPRRTRRPTRYRLTAFDNRGVGRTAMSERPVSVEAMADDAAAVLWALAMR